jgi:phage terminase small subunit
MENFFRCETVTMPSLKNARHEVFAQARVSGLTIDAAYVEAGYKPNRGNAARMNANESIQGRIAELQDAAARRALVTAADALREIARVGLSDIRQAFDANGNLLPIHKLPDGIAQALSSAKVTTKKVSGADGNTQIVSTVEIKLWDKNSALEKLAKHFCIYDKTSEDDPASKLLAAIMDGARPLPVAAQ